MTLDELNNDSGLPGVLHFDSDPEYGGLTRAQITLPTCTATVYLHGAHLTHWQPAGQQDVLFLSERSEFAPGKAIRGGIPVCFPWFGPDAENRMGGKPGPSHGFARVQGWEFAFAALLPGADDLLHLTFTLAPSELSRSLGYGDFRVAYEMVFGADHGRAVTLKFSVANPGDRPMHYEEALHTYFAVADARQAQIDGLGDAAYLDKVDGLKRKNLPPGPLQLTGMTDRVFPGNESALTIQDQGNRRSIGIAKQGSTTTVVWNPWVDGAATLKDMLPDEWPEFLCVEAANTGADAITLQPREARTMQVEIRLTGGVS